MFIIHNIKNTSISDIRKNKIITNHGLPNPISGQILVKSTHENLAYNIAKDKNQL